MSFPSLNTRPLRSYQDKMGSTAAQQQHTASVVAVDVSAFLPSSLHTEGPTPGALQEMLDSLDKYTEQVRTNLFCNLMSSLAGSADPQVLAAMVALADVSSSSGTEQWVAQCANKYMEMQQHVAALQAELKAAQAAADLEATLLEFKTFIDNGQYNDAAYSLVQLRKILEDSNSSSEPGGKQVLPGSELAALQAGCTSCETALEEALESSLAEAFDVNRAAATISITSTLPSGGDVGDVWAAMELAGSLDKHLQSVASVLLQELVPHLLSGAAYLDVHTSNGGALLRWYGAAPAADGSYDTQHVEGQIMQLLSVLAHSLFRQRPATLSAFGGVFWAPLVAQYEAAFLQQIQGSSVAVLQARQEAARSMEQQAVSMGLAEPGSELASCLSRSIQQSYHAVQEQFLAQARDLLLPEAQQHTESVVVGQPLPLDADFLKRAKDSKAQAWELLDPPSGWDTSGPVLATGYFHISTTALQMVMLIDDAMAQACHQGDTSMAQAIVGAVSKMALMYVAMLEPPAPNDAPFLVLLRHNDLQYVANHLLVAPFLFDPELKQLLGAGLWFGNEALQLRSTARAAYTDLLNAQKATLNEHLQPLLERSAALSSPSAGASRGPQADKEGKDPAASATRRVLHTLGHAGQLLWPYLAPGMALEASQQLVEHVAGVVLADVLRKKDIGEAETHELEGLYKPLLGGLLEAVLSHADLSSQGIQLEGLDLQQLARDALQYRCPALKKAQGVLDLLQCRLADIVGAWERGVLTADGFTLQEVEGLVMALFEDTDYRAECLQRIEAAAEVAS